MSQEWLNIQSFFVDQKVLGAINELSIVTKQELAQIEDEERSERSERARQTLKDFLIWLDKLDSASEEEVSLGIDSRSRELVDAFRRARRDSASYKSPLMRGGASQCLVLLDATDASAKRQLLECLADLRRIIARHQQVDNSAIFEDF